MNNKSKSNKTDRKSNIRMWKLRTLSAIFIVAIVWLSVNIVIIKAGYGDEYERKAMVQQVSKSNTSENAITPNRGSILDRNRSTQALAVSTTVYNVFIDPLRILKEEEAYQNELISTLGLLLEIPQEDIRAAIASNPESQYKVIKKAVNIKLKETVETAKLKIIIDGAEKEFKLRNVYFDEDTERKYPAGNLAASLIGFIRGESAWGLEEKYNLDLTGLAGRELRIFDENNNAITEKVDPVKGNTLITTLDLLILQEAQKLVAQYGEMALAKNAALLVMNPNTGEILAMAEYPSYDLNDPFNVEKINSEYHKSLILAEPEEKRLEKMYEICRNFSILDTFEPGSIYKPLVYAAAIEEGIISEHETFDCSGGKDIFGTYVPCWYTAGHGRQDYRQAMANSCNVAVMNIIERLGREKYFDYQCDFGIGGTTGIDFPGEPNTEKLVHGLAALNPVELQVSSMGQGLTATSLQMITAFSSIINGGNLMKPYTVSQVIDENGNVVSENAPTIIRKVISKETSDIMKEAMISVVNEGTGRKAAIEGYRIGGKTGTGQQGDKSDPENDDLTLSFMAYFPADNPEYIVLSVINLPENYVEGDSKTLPMVKDMINFIITQKRIPAYDKELAKEVMEDDTLVIDNYEGLNIAQVTKSLNYYGFVYDISGSGDVVKNQFPSGGSKVTKGSKIYLTAEIGVEPVPLKLIPNVTGMNAEQAIEAVESAGLTPIVIDASKSDASLVQGNAVSSEAPKPKTVINQLPKYEIKVPENTEILIYVDSQ